MSLRRLVFISDPYVFIRTRIWILSVIMIVVITVLLPLSAASQGNLLITPRRVVFEGAKRSFDLNLANIGKDTATYVISLVQIRMKEDGGFETITVPDQGQNFADQNVRFYPRSVVLPPNEAQVVKVQLLRTAQLAPGEYRSHFYFRSVPKIDPLGGETTVAEATSISVKLTPVFGITIPVIIRIGEATTRATLSELMVEETADGAPSLRLTFNRTGNFSIYGDLTVDHVSASGKISRVAAANGVAVYTPNSVRHFHIGLNNIPGIDLNSGKLVVTYSAPGDGKPSRYAQSELILSEKTK
jgi:hypothetical protein